jgi:Protein of unknown function (DUF2637)
MSAETTSGEGSGPGNARTETAPVALRVLATAAVSVGLAALAGGTFILSYSGIHALALHAGIAPRLARGYPLLLDAMLVIALAAVLALREADRASRLLAWTTLLAVLAAAAGADALHAAGHRLPGHVAAITAAVLPWVLVFLAFALLLAMLRHARMRRLAGTRAAGGDPLAIAASLQVPVRQPQTAPALEFDAYADSGSEYSIAYPALTMAHRPEPSVAVSAIAGPARLEVEQSELAADAEPRQMTPPDDAASDEAADQTEPAGETYQDEAEPAGATYQDQADQTGQPAGQTAHDEQNDPDMPVFHRMWSSPTPPEP